MGRADEERCVGECARAAIHHFTRRWEEEKGATAPCSRGGRNVDGQRKPLLALGHENFGVSFRVAGRAAPRGTSRGRTATQGDAPRSDL